MRRGAVPFLLLAWFALPAAKARAACGPQELQNFVARAQAGDKAAAAQGDALVRCPDGRGQAVQWQAFLLAISGDQAKARKVDDPNPGRTQGGAREAVLARAKAGQYKDLKAKVEDQEPGYANSPEALLVLARVLTRKGEFAGGREAYVAYLRLNPEADDAEAEYLYTFIWEGNLAEAESRLNAAARFAMRPGLAAAVQRGRQLVTVRQKTAPKQTSGAARKTLAGLYEGELSAHHLKNVYQRRTARAAYEGPVDFSLAAHSLDVDSIETYKARATEARFGAHGSLGQTFLYKAHVGYFSPGDDHYVGDAAFGLAILPDLITDAGVTRDPLALVLPLVQDDLDLMRDTAFIGVRYARYVELRLSLQKEKDYAAHEEHTLLARVPIVDGDGDGPRVSLRFPAMLELHPNPSPNYASDPRIVTMGAGAEMQRDFGGRWTLAFVLDYSMARVEPRGGGETDPVGILAAEADAAIPLDESWKLTVLGRYYRADEEFGVYTRAKLSGLGIGLRYEDLGQP